jgi:sigma-B regulation protein RsbU (phosphoserine phosphatase)
MKRPLRGRFVSPIYATGEERERLFRIASAGLLHPVGVRNREVFSIKAGGMPLGLLEGAEYEERAIACDAEDLVVFYTDGVTEAVDGVKCAYRRFICRGKAGRLFANLL